MHLPYLYFGDPFLQLIFFRMELEEPTYNSPHLISDQSGDRETGTFIDNHDTYQLAIAGNLEEHSKWQGAKSGRNKKLLGTRASLLVTTTLLGAPGTRGRY